MKKETIGEKLEENKFGKERENRRKNMLEKKIESQGEKKTMGEKTKVKIKEVREGKRKPRQKDVREENRKPM